MPGDDAHSQEIRFAIVLYGGVSLAVYINGVVQELLRLVRATADVPIDTRTSEGAYRKLGQILERGRTPEPKDYPADGAPIKTRFKIDIISGTSAGGLNGIYLAKALVGNKDISDVQDLWFNEGDIEKLLNDAQSYQDLDVQRPDKTESLLNSRRMYLNLLGAFDNMDKHGRPPQSSDDETSALAEEIDVFATITDIEGVPVPIRLLDNIVYERRYRNAFHFRFTERERNDFQADNNPFLAFAARCTSSFPFAFEPMRLCDVDEMLTSHPVYSHPRFKYCKSDSTRWQKFYTNYLNIYDEQVYAGAVPFPQRSFGDGGYLNNAPFSFAVDTLLTRQSDVPIDRKLLYVEPSPTHVEELPGRRERPNAVQNSLAALITIPGYQTIRNDLNRVLERNREASKINKALADIERHILQGADADYHDGSAEELPIHSETCYRAYYQLRATDVTDQLALIFARLRMIDEESVNFTSLRSLLRAWREKRFGSDAPRDLGGFLRNFDINYRARRLRFVLRKLDTLFGLRLPRTHPVYLDAARIRQFALGVDETDEDRPDDIPEDLPQVWGAVAQEYQQRSDFLRRLTETPLPPDTDTPPFPGGPLPDTASEVSAVANALPARTDVVAVLANIAGVRLTMGFEEQSQTPLMTRPLERSADETRNVEVASDERATAVYDQFAEHIERVEQAMTNIFSRKFQGIHERVTAAFGAGDAGKIARYYYERFDLFDSVQFPISFATPVGEPDVVDIIRVCPEDAEALIDDVTERREKLKGLAIAHFGAFLDKDWRVSDLLWGRLDAAERIITALLPLNESIELRNRLIDEAHSGILHEFDAQRRLGDMMLRQARDQGPEARLTQENLQDVLAAASPPPPPATREGHRHFMQVWRELVPNEPNRVAATRSVARGTTIVGRMLEAISNGSGISLPAAWLTRIGWLLWGMVEISVPRRFSFALASHWLSLLLLIAVVLIAGGLLTTQAALTGFGWSLVVAIIATVVVRTTLRKFFSGNNWRAYLILTLIAAVVAAIIYGGYRLYDWGLQKGGDACPHTLVCVPSDTTCSHPLACVPANNKSPQK